MKFEKTYYSISEVAKMLNIHEHTIRFWDSKLSDLSTRSDKGRTRFFNGRQIKKISKINELLKNNDSLNLAYSIVSNKKLIITHKNSEKEMDSINKNIKITKISSIINKLNKLLYN